MLFVIFILISICIKVRRNKHLTMFLFLLQQVQVRSVTSLRIVSPNSDNVSLALSLFNQMNSVYFSLNAYTNVYNKVKLVLIMTTIIEDNKWINVLFKINNMIIFQNDNLPCILLVLNLALNCDLLHLLA